MIYAQPGATFIATLDQSATGLAGTLGVRILDTPAGTVIMARRTAGITEAPSGSGLYGTTLTAPATAGVYSVVWDDGSGHYAREDLTVTYSRATSTGPSGGDLCTVAQVKERLQKGVADTTQDDVIQTLITAASEQVELYTKVRFLPETGDKLFIFRGGYSVDLAPYVARSVSAVVVDSDQSSTSTLSTTDYALRPVQGWHGVYRTLRVLSLGQQVVGPQWPGDRNYGERQVTVTGTWGFASVPASVQNWCVVAVVDWLRGGVQAFSTTVNTDTGQVNVPQELPSAVRFGLRSWKRVTAP